MSFLRVSFLIPVISLLASAPVAGEPDNTVIAAAASPSGHGVTELRFREMFRLPVGPRGLEPSQKLLDLNGRRVRIVGYMVEQETMHNLILAPLPLKLGDEDESFADDLPPGVVFVHFAAPTGHVSHHIPGLLELTGILDVGSFAESDGRVSTVRLTVDTVTSQEMSRHDVR